VFRLRNLRRCVPEGVLELVGDVAEPVNDEDCTACAACMEECPMGAITEIEDA
jgi:NAD-dependent dihydropyrimidine dehydrogenase PreA subunit